MNLRALLSPDAPRWTPVALLLVRAATGLMILPHGVYKFVDGARGLASGLARNGFPAPNLLAWLAALAELVGGACMVLGVATRPAALSVAFTMLVAFTAFHLKDLPRIGAKGGAAFEYPFLLFACGVAVALAGPGALSVDGALSRRRREARRDARREASPDDVAAT